MRSIFCTGHFMETEIEIKTWRPFPSTPFAKLRRYFLGGVQMITDTSFFLPSQRQVEGFAI